MATLDTVDQNILEKIKDKKLEINLENGTRREVYEYKAFWCKKKCYIWDSTKNVFSRLVGLDVGTNCSDLHFSHSGLSKEEQLLRYFETIHVFIIFIRVKSLEMEFFFFLIKIIQLLLYKSNYFIFCLRYRRIVYGSNNIIVPLQSIGVLLLLEVLNPFYIFQVFTLCVWFADEYLYYPIAIVLMSLYGITTSIVQTRKVHRKGKISHRRDKTDFIYRIIFRTKQTYAAPLHRRKMYVYFATRVFSRISPARNWYPVIL